MNADHVNPAFLQPQAVGEGKGGGDMRPYEFRSFEDIPADDDFISPEGSWCRKIGMASARMLDEDDMAYKVGDVVPFRKNERVEYVPRHTSQVPAH